MDNQPSGSAPDSGDTNDESGSGKVGESECEGVDFSLQDRLKWLDHHVKKVGSTPPLFGLKFLVQRFEFFFITDAILTILLNLILFQ